MINDFRDFFKIDSKIYVMSKEWFNLQVLIFGTYRDENFQKNNSYIFIVWYLAQKWSSAFETCLVVCTYLFLIFGENVKLLA